MGKQKIPKTLFLAKFKKKQKNLKLPPSSFLSKTNLRYQFFDHLKWVVRYSICYYCVIYAHYSVYLIVFSARFFSHSKRKKIIHCVFKFRMIDIGVTNAKTTRIRVRNKRKHS